MLIEIIKAIILGIIQGITEWLPISSTGHMILVNQFLQLDISPEFQSLFFVVIQLGSILAVVVLFFNKLNPFSLKKTGAERKATIVLWLKVLVAAIPAGVIGVLFDDIIDEIFFDNVYIIATTLIIYGLIFILLEILNKSRKLRAETVDDITFVDAIVIGLFQVLSLIPGTSRSGSTILGGMISGINRVAVAEFSFFLALPVMAGASLLKLVKFGFVFTLSEIFILVVGVLVAFGVSLFAIRFLMDYIKKHDFKVFGFYRIILGVIVLLYFLLIK
jgi:undecaprenyl-diphosphatase UppP